MWNEMLFNCISSFILYPNLVGRVFYSILFNSPRFLPTVHLRSGAFSHMYETNKWEIIYLFTHKCPVTLISIWSFTFWLKPYAFSAIRNDEFYATSYVAGRSFIRECDKMRCRNADKRIGPKSDLLYLRELSRITCRTTINIISDFYLKHFF